MPIPKKWTNAQIVALYDEAAKQDKDLKTFLTEKGYAETDYKAIHKRFQRLEKRRAKGLPDVTPTSSPEDVVKATIVEATATEAREQTEQLLTIGRAVKQAYFRWAVKRGMDVEEMKKLPLHKVILTAMEKEARFDDLVKENLELRDALRVYAQETNPMFRLKSAIKLLNDFLQFMTLAELIGFNVEDSSLIDHYQNLMELYLKGGAG